MHYLSFYFDRFLSCIPCALFCYFIVNFSLEIKYIFFFFFRPISFSFCLFSDFCHAFDFFLSNFVSFLLDIFFFLLQRQLLVIFNSNILPSYKPSFCLLCLYFYIDIDDIVNNLLFNILSALFKVCFIPILD